MPSLGYSSFPAKGELRAILDQLTLHFWQDKLSPVWSSHVGIEMRHVILEEWASQRHVR